MVQENMTVEEAIKVMEEGQKAPDRPAPMLPPKLLGEYRHVHNNKRSYLYMIMYTLNLRYINHFLLTITIQLCHHLLILTNKTLTILQVQKT